MDQVSSPTMNEEINKRKLPIGAEYAFIHHAIVQYVVTPLVVEPNKTYLLYSFDLKKHHLKVKITFNTLSHACTRCDSLTFLCIYMDQS